MILMMKVIYRVVHSMSDDVLKQYRAARVLIASKLKRKQEQVAKLDRMYKAVILDIKRLEGGSITSDNLEENDDE